MSDIQRRHMDEGYYGGAARRGSDNQQRHTDEGYYSEVKPYAPSPIDDKPVVAPLSHPIQVGPPPLIVPAVGAGGPGSRKFGDDIGGTGSITATRHAKQAKDLLQSGHFDLAKSHFRESLAHSPEQLDLYPGYWETCAKTNDWGEAKRALEKFFEMDANKRKEYLWAYGETWYQLKNFDKAVPVLKEASKYGVHEEDVHNDLLKIALNQHNAAEIPVEYAAVIKINPSDVKTHLDFANWLEVQGRHTDAIGQYRAAANLTPGDGSLAARLAYMLMYYNHDYRTAIGYYHKAISADPSNAAKYQENIKYAEAQGAQSSPSAPAKKREQQ